MPLIEAKNLVKTYVMGDTHFHALDELSLKIDEGEVVAIMGPSGSGKSTLMNILGFLDVPTHGSYLFEGKAVEDYTEEQLAEMRGKKIGFVFQSFYLLPRMSAIENVMLPMVYVGMEPEAQRERAAMLLKRVGLGDKLDNQPNELSGGQQQRVAIARALANDPKIIFADEPTGNLDSKSSKEIMKILDELAEEGRTIVLVTHEDEIATHAKRVLTLKDGKLLKDKKQKAKRAKATKRKK